MACQNKYTEMPKHTHTCIWILLSSYVLLSFLTELSFICICALTDRPHLLSDNAIFNLILYV